MFICSLRMILALLLLFSRIFINLRLMFLSGQFFLLFRSDSFSNPLVKLIVWIQLVLAIDLDLSLGWIVTVKEFLQPKKRIRPILCLPFFLVQLVFVKPVKIVKRIEIPVSLAQSLISWKRNLFNADLGWLQFFHSLLPVKCICHQIQKLVRKHSFWL